ncbi:MAG: transcription termination/antitermination factor NusG [Clostridia bacterium]|nr:transcription termination/antitermination factor NusG [Clostridia bacterium]
MSIQGKNTVARWYVVHTYSGYENKVAANLEKMVENRKMHDIIQDIRIPMETVTEVNNNETRVYERKMFPGYVLVKMVMSDDSWFVVRNITGVTGFVGPEAKATPLTNEEVEALGVEVMTVSLPYNVGDTVKVTSGPFEGYVGSVDALAPEKNRVTVVVSMFGRETPLELELDQVAPLE